MDAILYLKEKARMTKNCTIDCKRCHFKKGDGYLCSAEEDENPEKAVSIVEKWSAEHPIKTYLSELLEKFPDTLLVDEGTPDFCPDALGLIPKVDYCPDEKSCKDCWNQPKEV